MKTLILFLLTACASYHHVQVNPPAFKPTTGESHGTFVSSWGKPQECVSFETSQYCRWEKGTFHFQQDKLVSELTAPTAPLTYELNLVTLSAGKTQPLKTALIPGVKRLSPNGIEWRRYYPSIEKAMKISGLPIVPKLEESQQFLKVNFGVKNAGAGKARRFLSLSAYDTIQKLKKKQEVEQWKVHITSTGSTRDLTKVFPILLAIAQEAVQDPGNLNKSLSLKEDSLALMAFQHHLAAK